MKTLFFLPFTFLLIVQSALAQREAEEEDNLPFIPGRDTSTVVEMDLKNLRFLPFVAPAVSPEVGFMISGGGLVSFKIDPNSKILQRSSVPFSFGYSTNNSANMNIRPTLFFKNDKNRVSGDIWMKNMPDNYWGVGYDAARKPAKPDSTTGYSRNWWQVYLKYVHQFKTNFFAGILFDYNQTKATSMNPQMKEDPNVRRDGSFIRNWSAGLLLQYDSRDVTVNAYEGVFVELSSNFYRSKGFEKPVYQVVVLDYRQYKQIKRPGRTLAWQMKTRVGLDKVPWTEMSQIGTPFDLRGYRWGRYRDRSMLFGIMEYRHMFMKKKPRKDGNMMSRFGFVTWLAAGSVAPDFPSFNDWLPNGGLGLRFEVQKRMNARIDVGFGEDSAALYISFNEAF